MSSTVIVGIDEAGRGPLAGPVVAAAVHLSCPVALHARGGWTAASIRLFDSKQLTADEREAAYAWITGTCSWGVAAVSAEEIDRNGILEATNRAMQEALAMLARTVTPTYLLVDGRDTFWFDYVHSSIIEGDAKEPSIAAASIVAKVTRDRFMTEQARMFPHYGFAEHKGYAAPRHIDALKEHGPCPLHRKSFLTSILPIAALAGSTAAVPRGTPAR